MRRDSSCVDQYHSDQIRENVLVKQYQCEVDIAHLISYDEELASRLNKEPAEVVPLVSDCPRLAQFQSCSRTMTV